MNGYSNACGGAKVSLMVRRVGVGTGQTGARSEILAEIERRARGALRSVP